MRLIMKLLSASVLSFLAAFSLCASAATPITENATTGASVSATKTSDTGSITETVGKIKSDASTMKNDVQQGNISNLSTDKDNLKTDAATAKEQFKNSFSFGSGSSTTPAQ